MLKKLVNQINQAAGTNNTTGGGNTAPSPAPKQSAPPSTTRRATTTTTSRKAPGSTTAPKSAGGKKAPAPAGKKAPAKPTTAKQPAAAAVVHTNPAHNTLRDGSSFDGIFDPDTMLPLEGKATFSNGDTMEGKWDPLGTFYEGTFHVLGTPPIIATGNFWYPSGATRPRLKSGRLTKGDLIWEGEFDSTTTKGFLRTGTRTTKVAIESGVFQELPNGQGITLVHGKQQMVRSGVVFEGSFDHRTTRRIEGKETLKSGMVSEGQWQWNGSNEICVQGTTTWMIPKAGSEEKQIASFRGTKNLAGNWVAGEYKMPTGDSTTGSYAVVPTGTTQKKFRLEKGLNVPAAKTATTREGFFVSKGGITQLVHGRSVANVTAASLKEKCNKAKTPGALEDKTQLRVIQEGDFTDAAFIGTQRAILIEHFEVEVQSSLPVEDDDATAAAAGAQDASTDLPHTEDSMEKVQPEDEEAAKTATACTAKSEDGVDKTPEEEDRQDDACGAGVNTEEKEESDEKHPKEKHVDPTSGGVPREQEETAPAPMKLTDDDSPMDEDESAPVSNQIEQQQQEPTSLPLEIVTRTKLVDFDDSKEESVMGLQVFSTACPAFLWFADTITTTTASGTTATTTKTSTELLEYNLVQIEKAFLCGANFFNLMDDSDAPAASPNTTSSSTAGAPPSSTADSHQEIINFSTMETNRGRKIRREAVSVTKAKSFGHQKDPHSYHTRFALPQYLWTFVDDFSAEEGEPLPIEASLALEDAFYKGDVDLVEFDEDLDNARVSLWEEPRRYWRVPGEEPRPIRREVMTVSMALETETYLKAFLLLNAPLLKSTIDQATANEEDGSSGGGAANTAESQKLPADPEMVDGFMLQYSKTTTTSLTSPRDDSSALVNIGRQGSLSSSSAAHGFDFFDRLPVSLKMRLRPQLAMSRNIDIELTKDWTVASIKSRLLIAHLKYCTAVFQDEDYSDDVKELLRPLTAQWGGIQLNKDQRFAVQAAQDAEEDDLSSLNLPPFLFEVERVPENNVRARFIGDDNAVDACLYLAMRWVVSESQFKQPSNWQTLDPNNDREETIRMEKNANYLFNVNLSTPEHTEVQKFFNLKFKKEITKIQRIQNTVLYEKYVQKRRQIAKEHHGDANEVRWLWHGTRGTEPMLMCSDGFDMRFCDKGFYGRASYFAYDAHYSHNFRHNNGDGTASMFLALVTCGLIEEKTQKDENIRRPEPPCHSIKGPVTQSGMEAIMIYELNQAYPAYLVTYRI